MGLSFEFYAGDAQSIGVEFGDVDSEEWVGAALAYADFSLHLHADDLDSLSVVVAESLRASPLLLWESLTVRVGTLDDGETGDAWIVASEWVSMTAAVDEDHISSIASNWMARVSDRCGEQLDVDDVVVSAIHSLRDLCRLAITREVDVVFIWYL